MPAVKPTEAELAERALAATRVLKRSLASAAKAEAEADNRSTGSRAKYKAGFDAAEEALTILTGRSAPQSGTRVNTKVPKPTAKQVQSTVGRARNSAAAKSNVVPISKAPSAPKKSSGRKIQSRAK